MVEPRPPNYLHWQSLSLLILGFFALGNCSKVGTQVSGIPKATRRAFVSVAAMPKVSPLEIFGTFHLIHASSKSGSNMGNTNNRSGRDTEVGLFRDMKISTKKAGRDANLNAVLVEKALHLLEQCKSGNIHACRELDSTPQEIMHPDTRSSIHFE
eukprot:CAMPEP_0184487284 /NCGR_PEP_ID=MMETSP0113_2-20130426/9686_1 /TAXON_ID=91329 /ORGANISM="Norrisiella sphaerica, Strain BC52" /LENGTH=154 /DNA_ID=CAMNT_0026869529 /DNA_START=41 /DNA_END=505 /DNA_ORIENTATION=+